MMKIDSHHHLWTLARGDYSWMTPDLGPIYRDFTPNDLAPHLKAVGIDKTILVQAADTVAETEFMLELADSTDWIAGVIGWVDMEASDAVSTLTRLARNPHFKGIRPMIQGLDDDDWILRPALNPVFDALIEMGLTFDALVLPKHLPQLLKRLHQTPGLRCVIDHGAKPDLAGGNINQWQTDMSRLAVGTGCLCKLSGLITEAGADYTIETIRPAAAHILDQFGPDRVMFGSDWPVLNLAGTYPDWIQMVEDLTKEHSEAAQDAIWGGTAARFYSID